MSTGVHRPTQIRVAGHLDDHWGAWLGDLALTRDDDGTTTVAVVVADQAQLHGVLAGLRDIGAILVGLRTTDAYWRSHRAAGARAGALHAAPHPPPRHGPDDADPTWIYRRLPAVNEWLTERPPDRDGYREHVRGAGTAGDHRRRHSRPRRRGPGHRRPHAPPSRTPGPSPRSPTARPGSRPSSAGSSTRLRRPRLHHRGGAGARSVTCSEDLGVRRVVANCFLGNDAPGG